MNNIYDNFFFNANCGPAKKAAECIMPLIIEKLKPCSIVDIGCARGVFLAEVKKYGINVLGIDGDYVDRDKLWIEQSEFIAHDVGEKISLSQKYDIAMSFEVAEHIEATKAEQFVDNLVNLSDVIVFSAAIPMQGGEYHVNEQWQSYWQEKFKRRGYRASLCLRNFFWNECKIESFRRQNILLFIKEEFFEEIEAKFGKDIPQDINVVHPAFYEYNLKMWKEYVNYLEKSQEKQCKLLKEVIDKRKMAELLIDTDINDLITDFSVWENFIFDSEVINYCKENLTSKERQNGKYILWGGGTDGQKIAKLLMLLGNEVSVWCDARLAGSIIEGIKIISPEEMFQKYSDEMIIIGSRKFRKEIEKTIVTVNENLREKILSIK